MSFDLLTFALQFAGAYAVCAHVAIVEHGRTNGSLGQMPCKSRNLAVKGPRPEFVNVNTVTDKGPRP